MAKSDPDCVQVSCYSDSTEDGEFIETVWTREKLEHLKEEKKPTGLSEKEMKKIICDMVTKYDASEEEVFDELQSQDQSVTRDVAHRLYKMCNGDKNKESRDDFFRQQQQREIEMQRRNSEPHYNVRHFI